jgi:hypothetical protein
LYKKNISIFSVFSVAINETGGLMSEKKKVCMICGKPSEVTICDSCKAQIQGEAIDKKEKMEKDVRVGEEIEKDRKIKHKGD